MESSALPTGLSQFQVEKLPAVPNTARVGKDMRAGTKVISLTSFFSALGSRLETADLAAWWASLFPSNF